MQTQSSSSSQTSSDALSSDDNFLLSSDSEQAESDESDVFLPAGPASSSSSGIIIGGGGGASSGGGGATAVDRGGGRVGWRAYSVSVKEEEVNEGASDRSYGSQGSGGGTSGHHRGQQSSGCSTSGHHRGQQGSGGGSTSGHHRGQQGSGGGSTSGHHRGQQGSGCSTSTHHWGQQRKDTATHNAKTHGDLLFSQKCAELQGFVRPLLDLLKGLKRGRFDRGLSSLQQTVAMDRIQRIIGVLQRPNSGEKYLNTILKVETMLKQWFPQVPTNSALSASSVTPPDLSQLGGAPASPALPHKHRDQRHIPVKKRRLSWTGTDPPSLPASPVPAKRLHGCGKEDEEEEVEDEEHEVVEETQERREGETLSLETDPGRDGQTDRTERSTKEERTEERSAVHL